MFGELTNQEIEEVLHGATVGRLGCHANGRTYVVPIGYAYDGGRILVQTVAGMKVDMMRTNPEVCFEVEEVKSPMNWRTVIVWGTFVELSGVEAAAAVGLLVDRMLPILQEGPSARFGRAVTPTLRDRETRPRVVFAIELRERSGRFERDG
ncbi:MAG: pyridoxamine 5'-phosphate oxidase family protein [Fimbriimonas sp.]